MVIGIDANILLGYYQAKAGIPAASLGGSGSSAAATKVAPTPPWNTTETPQQASAKVTAALVGHKIVDENAAQLDLPGASADYKKLFALYQGLGTLSDLANQANAAGTSSIQKSQLQKAFQAGMTEVSKYISSADLDKIRLTQGETDTSDKTKLAVPNQATEYDTPPLANSSSDSVPALEGDVQFTIQVTRLKETYDIPIDLSAMPDQTRSIANVVNYVNDQLKAAGLETRFGTVRTPGEPKQITAGSQTITLPAGPDQWGLKVTAGTGETINFTAPQTANAVYVAQQVGDADPDHDPDTSDSTVSQQLLKFQTDTTSVPSPPQISGQANWVDGRVFANALDPSVKTVHAQTVGPDGAIYMLADVDGTVAGQSIKGDQDVALLKYDAAGHLVYTRTLGAASSATGLSLAVSADGKVAIGGSVSGTLDGATEGALNSGTQGAYAGEADSFVTLFDKDGQELWTQRRGASKEDQVNQVAFGADGATVYVAGQTKSAMPGGGAAQGDWDSYVTAFATSTTGKVSTLFTQDIGTDGGDKPKGMVVDGNTLTVATNENGRAVLHQYDVSGETPVEINSRDLGDLEGGDIVGLALDSNGQLVVGGYSANPALSVDTVTSAASGGLDAFAARIGGDLNPSASDTLAYYGGAGDDKATAMAVSNGQVWLAGTAGTDLPDDQAPVGKQDGFLANLNVDTGAVDWSRRFTGASGKAAPTAIAVAPQGASVLDRLGLPTGTLSFDSTEQITAVSSVRAGDQFTVSANGGVPQTVTIDADDTLDTLALKIRRASGFTADVQVTATTDHGHQLTIKPVTNNAVLQFGAGKGDTDALSGIGIPVGVVRATTTTKDGKQIAADGKPNIYGLNLPTDLNLSDSAQISHALAELAGAQDVIRQAYKDLVTAATPKAQQAAAAAAAAGKSGSVPAYMTAQISNYQAALDRLTGGSSSSSGTTDPSLALFGITG